jgi:hypothetical protein
MISVVVILQKPFSELQAAHANERRDDLGERQRGARAALRRRAVIVESQDTEGLSWALPAGHERGREALAGCIGKVSEDVLAASAGESGGGALNRALHGEAGGGVHESEDNRGVRAGATGEDDGEERVGENSVTRHGLLLSGGP